MGIFLYKGKQVNFRDGESVLDALLRQGVSIPFSCRSGVCHVCMQQCNAGEVPPASQHGLHADLVAQKCFLACQCKAAEAMEISAPEGIFETTLVAEKKLLSPYVVKILLEPPATIVCKPGQFINIRRKDGVVRSYSIACLPDEDYFLEFHVQRKQGGILSNWLMDELEVGEELDVSGPWGECYYREETADSPMLLVATGTGLSPVFGILRDALRKGHRGNIFLYHGGRTPDRFYLHDQLRKLEAQHVNFKYIECVSGNAQELAGAVPGRAHDVAFRLHDNLKGWQVYLAGLTEMVESAEQLALQNGAERDSIHADPFTLRDLRSKPRGTELAGTQAGKDASTPVNATEAGKYPPPDPELWSALRNGDMLTLVLQDFYGKVFEDPRLSGFFEGVTRQRAIEKQFSFMQQVITGEKVYFGDRPRNAHHWMVISDELFDYRANIMVDCLRAQGLAEEMVQRFHDLEEFFRQDIVKAAPFARTIGNIELPLDGYEELRLDVGTLCDTCEREVSAGESVKYHVRLGKIYCTECSTHQQANAQEAITEDN